MTNDYTDKPMQEIISDTRNYFISEYGQPSVQILDGKKYIVLNSYLQNYDTVINCFLDICDTLEINYTSSNIDTLSEILKGDMSSFSKKLAKKLTSIQRSLNTKANSKYYYRDSLLNTISVLNAIKNKNIGTNQAIILLNNSLNVRQGIFYSFNNLI